MNFCLVRSKTNRLFFLILFIDYLDSSSMPTSTSTFMNNLDEEIDLLIDEQPRSNPPSSSAFENLSSWQNDYFQQRQFYPNFFPTDTTLPMLSLPSSTNIDTDNSTNTFTTNPLTFM